MLEMTSTRTHACMDTSDHGLSRPFKVCSWLSMVWQTPEIRHSTVSSFINGGEHSTIFKCRSVIRKTWGLYLWNSFPAYWCELFSLFLCGEITPELRQRTWDETRVHMCQPIIWRWGKIQTSTPKASCISNMGPLQKLYNIQHNSGLMNQPL